MDKQSSRTSNIAAWILLIVNFTAMLACILMVALGLWIISSPSSLSSVIDASGSLVLKALFREALTLPVGIAVTAVAIFLFFVCFMGFYGAISRSLFLLFMYAALLILLLLLECALLYYFSTNLVQKGFQDDGQWTHAMRLAFKCCEHNISEPGVSQPPWSCCGPEAYPSNCTTPLVYKRDCHASIVSWLDRYQLPIYTSLAVFHVVLASCSLLRRSCRSSRSYS